MLQPHHVLHAQLAPTEILVPLVRCVLQVGDGMNFSVFRLHFFYDACCHNKKALAIYIYILSLIVVHI